MSGKRRADTVKANPGGILPAASRGSASGMAVSKLVMQRSTALIFALMLAAFIMATSVAWGVFETMPHLEDEHANFFQAQVFAMGRVTVDTPLDENSFFVPFVIDLNGQRFGKYPPGYPVLLALGILIHSPWLINSIAASTGLCGVYLLGRDLFDQETGLLAAALGAVSPMFVLLSGALLAHPLNMAMLVWFAWAFTRTRQSHEPHPLAMALLAGALLGGAAITRPYTALAIGFPFAVLALLDVIRKPRQALQRYGAFLVAFTPVFAILPLYNYTATGSFFTNTYTLWMPYDTIGFGPQVGQGPDGHTFTAAVLNTQRDLDALGHDLQGWPIVGLPLSSVPIALCFICRPVHKREYGLLIPPITLVIAQMAYWLSAAGIFGPRYYFEALPFLWIASARGLIKLSSTRLPCRLTKALLPGLIIWTIVFSIAPKFKDAAGLDGINRKDADIIAQRGLKDALVFVRGDYWTHYANLSWLNQPDLKNNVLFAQDRGPVENPQVILDYPRREVYYYDRSRQELIAGEE